MFENYRLNTFVAEIYNGAWPAAPPADLQIAAVAAPANHSMYSRIGAGLQPVDNLNLRDVLRLKRFALYCNFADGLIFKQGSLQAMFGLGRAGDPGMIMRYGTITVPVIFLNTWIETHLNISDKNLVSAAVTAGTLAPTDNLSLYCNIIASGAPAAEYCTTQINPALASALDPCPAGASFLIFTLVAEVAHSYGET